MLRIFYPLLAIILFFHQGFAQDKSAIDKLNQSAKFFWDYNDTDSIAYFAQQALAMSRKINYLKGEAKALENLCFSCYIKGDYDRGLELCRESILVANKSKQQADISMAQQFLGLIFINQSKYEKAIEIFTPLVEQATRENDMYLLADICGNLGLSYLNLKNYQKAFDYLITARDLHKSIDNPGSKVWLNINIGRMYLELNQNDSSLHYLRKAVEMGKALGSKRSIVHADALMGQIYIREGKLGLAQTVISHAEQLANTLNLSWEKANLALLSSELFFKKQDYLNSIEYGKKAIALGKKSGELYILQKANNILAKSLLHVKNIKGAQQQVEAFKTMYDSLTGGMKPDIYEKTIRASNLLEEARNFETIKNELNIANAEIQQRKTIILATLFSVFMVAIVLFLILRSNIIKTKNYKELATLNAQVQTQKKHLEIVNRNLNNFNKEKDALLGMVAHDIRSPLNKISGLINILKMENKLGQEHDHIVEIVEKTIKEANLLVNELLEVNKIEAGAIEVQAETFDLSQFLNDIVFFFKDTASLKNIDLGLHNNVIKEITTDKKYLQRILENLISNAIKYSEKNSHVNIFLQKQNDKIGITVKDNGQGISEDEHKNLFTKFGKTSCIPTGGEASNGLGLYIVNRLTKALHGDISFVSKPGEGSEFTVHLPVNYNQNM